MKRAWLYSRLSPRVDMEYHEAIQQRLRDYASSHSYEVAGESYDVCEKIAVDREGFKAGLDALASMKADFIVIPKISSVFRDIPTALEICKNIEAFQEKIISVEESADNFSLSVLYAIAKRAQVSS